MAKLKERIARSPLDLKVFKKFPYESDWKFRQAFSAMTEQGADTGELLYIAHKIDPKDRNSWINVWSEWGEKLEKLGDECLQEGHQVSARQAFVKAWNYYNNAEYGCVPSDTRFHDRWRRAVQAMHKAVPLYNGVLTVIKIPFEDAYLPGYYWRPDDSDKKRPTLIAVGGNESSGEQILLTSGPAAIERGYNYFTFEYPGHRGAVHLNYPGCIYPVYCSYRLDQRLGRGHVRMAVRWNNSLINLKGDKMNAEFKRNRTLTSEKEHCHFMFYIKGTSPDTEHLNN